MKYLCLGYLDEALWDTLPEPEGNAIMDRHSLPPTVVSRPMKGGHFGVMRFITTFDKVDAAERELVRQVNVELVEAGLELGFVPYTTPPWVVEQLRGESGERQIKGAKLGMTQNMGGTGASSVVHILEVM